MRRHIANSRRNHEMQAKALPQFDSLMRSTALMMMKTMMSTTSNSLMVIDVDEEGFMYVENNMV
jgi:hypothetical protein